MSKINDILDFLSERPGYLKEGKARLHDILKNRGYDCTEEDCAEALAEARRKSSDEQIIQQVESDEIPDNFELVSKWQNSNGEWLCSYRLKKSKEDITHLNLIKEDLVTALENIKVPKVKQPKRSVGSVAMEISLPDLHFGKGSLEELTEKFYTSIAELLNLVPIDRISRFILPVGNDGLNSEGMRGTTTAGTPQHDTAPWYETFVAYRQALVTAINYLCEYAPVDVIVVQGNHDWERMFYIGDVLEAYYSNSGLPVTVNNKVAPRKYYKHGECLIMYTHGDKEKPADLPLIMATEEPMMFATSKHREIHCGHNHREIVNEYRGIKTRFLPSICSTDDWHKQMGYEHYRCAQAYLWHETRGLEGFVQYNVD